MSENLDKILRELEKNYNVKKAKDIEKDEVLSTGVFPLDYVLSGGIHLCEGGHRIEFFGAESTAKTTFALHVVRRFQEEGKICVYMDAENSYDKEWAKTIGVDNDKLIIVKPTSLEQAGDLFVKLIPEVDLIVVDSIVSMIPEAEAERDTNQPTMGLQARVNAVVCRKIYEVIAQRKTAMIFINQLREKIGVMYGNPYTTGGGRAIKHMYNTRIEFKTGKPIDVNKERIGVEIKLKCIKNKKGTSATR
jgi:recombination protein RecA